MAIIIIRFFSFLVINLNFAAVVIVVVVVGAMNALIDSLEGLIEHLSVSGNKKWTVKCGNGATCRRR